MDRDEQIRQEERDRIAAVLKAEWHEYDELSDIIRWIRDGAESTQPKRASRFLDFLGSCAADCMEGDE